jgi:hypothetical protein
MSSTRFAASDHGHYATLTHTTYGQWSWQLSRAIGTDEDAAHLQMRPAVIITRGSESTEQSARRAVARASRRAVLLDRLSRDRHEGTWSASPAAMRLRNLASGVFIVGGLCGAACIGGIILQTGSPVGWGVAAAIAFATGYTAEARARRIEQADDFGAYRATEQL